MQSKTEMTRAKVPCRRPPRGEHFPRICPDRQRFFRPARRQRKRKNAKEIAPLSDLNALFGVENATVLDYWYDNSLLSKRKVPMRKFVPHPEILEIDVRFYRAPGFRKITCFACYLGEEYKDLYGETPAISFPNN